MKNYFLLFASFLLLFFSCSKNDEITSEPLEKKSLENKSISFKKPLIYDEIYQIIDGKEVDLTQTQNLTRSFHEFYDVTTIQPNYTYLGSILMEESINAGRYRPVGYPSIWKDTITISFSLPTKSKSITPNLSSFRNSIIEATCDKNFSGKQSQIFTYKMKQFSYYKELKLAFGANINISNFFNVNMELNEGKINNNSAMFIDFTQIYFNVSMDIPYDGNIFKDDVSRNRYLSKIPVYVNSVNYGRKGIILVESSKSYSEVSLAVRAAFNAEIVNGKLSIDTHTKEILNEAEIQICIIGGDGNDATKTVTGFNAFQEYIINGGVYSKEVYGVPITFSAAYAEDNSMFISEFDL